MSLSLLPQGAAAFSTRKRLNCVSVSLQSHNRARKKIKNEINKIKECVCILLLSRYY